MLRFRREGLPRGAALGASLAAALMLGPTVPAGAGSIRARAFTIDPNTAPVDADVYISAIDGTPTHSDQATVAVGQLVTLGFQVRLRSGAVLDVTQDRNTTYAASPRRGSFRTKNTWSPGRK